MLPVSLPDESLKKMVDVLIQVPKKLLGGIEAALIRRCASSRSEAQGFHFIKIARSLYGVMIRNYLLNSQHYSIHSNQSIPFSCFSKSMVG